MFDPFTLNTLIKEHGRILTLTKLSNSTYDAVSGTLTRTPTNYLARGQFYNDVPEMTENTAVTYGTKRAVISNLLANGLPTPQPAVQDLISYSGGDTSAITKVSPITSGGNVVCYLLHLDE